MKFLGRLFTLILAVIFGFWLSQSGVLAGTTVGGWMDSIMDVLPVTSTRWNDFEAQMPQSLAFFEEETETAAPQTSYPDQSSIDFQLVHSEVIRLTNELRTEKDLNPLAENTALNQAASVRAEETGTSFSHTRPDGRDAFTVFNDGIEYNYRLVGENLGMATYYMGEEDMAELIFNGWVESQGHYENMIRPEFQEIGVGVHYDGEFLYATQIFGTSM